MCIFVMLNPMLPHTMRRSLNPPSPHLGRFGTVLHLCEHTDSCSTLCDGALQLGNIGLAVAAVVVLTRAVKGTTLAPLRVYLWAAGGAFVTWRITSTTVRRLVRCKNPPIQQWVCLQPMYRTKSVLLCAACASGLTNTMLLLQLDCDPHSRQIGCC